MQFPRWIQITSSLSLTVAVIMLAIGVYEYALFALAERGTATWYPSFVWCMSALFFFNLPIVLKKRHARQVLQNRPPETSSERNSF